MLPHQSPLTDEKSLTTAGLFESTIVFFGAKLNLNAIVCPKLITFIGHFENWECLHLPGALKCFLSSFLDLFGCFAYRGHREVMPNSQKAVGKDCDGSYFFKLTDSQELLVQTSSVVSYIRNFKTNIKKTSKGSVQSVQSFPALLISPHGPPCCANQWLDPHRLLPRAGGKGSRSRWSLCRFLSLKATSWSLHVNFRTDFHFIKWDCVIYYWPNWSQSQTFNIHVWYLCFEDTFGDSW